MRSQFEIRRISQRQAYARSMRLNNSRDANAIADFNLRLLLDIFHTFINRVEQVLNVFFLDAGESDAYVSVAKGDRADAVLLQQMDAQRLGVHGFELEAHEVS